MDPYNDHIASACASVCKVTIEQSLQPVSPHAAQCPVHLSNDLATCAHIFIRHDGVHQPLQRPYHSPYVVIKRATKQFTV